MLGGMSGGRCLKTVTSPDRRAALAAALGFLSLAPREPELQLYTAASTHGAESVTSWQGWRARSTTSPCGATTGAAGARCSFSVTSSTRARRVPATRGREERPFYLVGEYFGIG